MLALKDSTKLNSNLEIITRNGQSNMLVSYGSVIEENGPQDPSFNASNRLSATAQNFLHKKSNGRTKASMTMDARSTSVSVYRHGRTPKMNMETSASNR